MGFWGLRDEVCRNIANDTVQTARQTRGRSAIRPRSSGTTCARRRSTSSTSNNSNRNNKNNNQNSNRNNNNHNHNSRRAGTSSSLSSTRKPSTVNLLLETLPFLVRFILS